VLWVVIQQKITVVQLLQGIAGGVMGKAAYAAGASSIAVGLAVHCTIAFAWTIVYLIIVRRSARLRRIITTWRGRLLLGVGYGVLVWLLMDFVVLPLSRATPTPLFSANFLYTLLAHVTVVGPPIVLLLKDGGGSVPTRD
jgi:uncharacterized membrane protein YagU involved in acid resistance